jgi:hypothetical protein
MTDRDFKYGPLTLRQLLKSYSWGCYCSEMLCEHRSDSHWLQRYEDLKRCMHMCARGVDMFMQVNAQAAYEL